jgi:ATP-dependent RNA helicase DDX24/MAK5
LYLYSFLSQHPGRTLLFVNAISTTKRLQPLFKLLNVPIYCLHAEMQQKQRLNSLEKFKANPNAVLIATDVAARGLDIPSVSHVIHYHIPNTFETFVHRSGRTARAGNKGVALMFVNAQDAQKYKKMCQGMKSQDLPDYPFNESLLATFKQRLTLAKTIENLMHKVASVIIELKYLILI